METKVDFSVYFTAGLFTVLRWKPCGSKGGEREEGRDKRNRRTKGRKEETRSENSIKLISPGDVLFAFRAISPRNPSIKLGPRFPRDPRNGKPLLTRKLTQLPSGYMFVGLDYPEFLFSPLLNRDRSSSSRVAREIASHFCHSLSRYL